MQTEQYQRVEIVLHSTVPYDNPFLDVQIDAVFTHEDGTVIPLPGFWNGEDEWKVRFVPVKSGTWTYKVTCSDAKNTGLTDEGKIVAAPCADPKNELQKHGYPRLEKDTRYFVYEDGTPFFYLADTHWMMPDYEHLHDCNYPGCTCGNQFKHVADDRIKKGFTVYQTYFCSQRYTKAFSGTEGWWTDGTFTKINPTAFNESMDIMIEYLTENGIVTALGFGTHYASIEQTGSRPEVMLSFARYCIARYACYPIIWITAQEITTPHGNAAAIWRQVGALVGQLDGYRHPGGAHMHVHDAFSAQSQTLHREPWHQWWTLQGGHGGRRGLRPRSFYQSYYEMTPLKPFAETECQYEDIYCGGFCGHDVPRMGAWQAMQCGSCGFTYGVTGLWAMGWDMKKAPGFASYNPEAWFQGVDKPGSEQVGFMKKFYEYVGWYKLKPAFGFEYGVFDMRKYVAISHIDDDVFLYYFFGDTPEIGRITGLKPNVKYQARWFDTVNGKFIDLPDVTSADGTMDIPPMPAARDWMLLLNDYDLGAYEAEVYPPMQKPIAESEAHPGEKLTFAAFRALSEDEDHPAANMIDGDPDTYWKGFAPYTSQTILGDFGQPEEVGYLYLDCKLPKMRFIEFRIYGSLDGESWTMLSERMGAQVAVGDRFQHFYEPISGKYRYIKFFLNSVALDAPFNTQLELTEFAVFKKQ